MRSPLACQLVPGLRPPRRRQRGRLEPWPARSAERPQARSTVSPALGDLLTYDYGNTRSGQDSVDPAIKNLSAGPTWDDRDLDGAVYGEPLVYDATVYVATENDTVYAIAAAHRQGALALCTSGQL